MVEEVEVGAGRGHPEEALFSVVAPPAGVFAPQTAFNPTAAFPPTSRGVSQSDGGDGGRISLAPTIDGKKTKKRAAVF